MGYTPSSETPVQYVVGIIHDFFMGNFDVRGRGDNGETVDIYDEYVSRAEQWTKNQLKDRGYNEVEILALFENHEDHENLPIYDEYYKARDQFVRKVLTAAANSL